MKKINKLLLLFLATMLVALCFVSCGVKTYTVTFKNGEETIATAIVSENSKIYPASVETAPGVNFDGWYENDATIPFDFKKSCADSDLMLYARFTSLNYKVTYRMGFVTETPAPTQTTVNYDGSFTITEEVPTREAGYKFLGWSDGYEVYQSDNNYNTSNKTDIVLTALWEYKTLIVRFYDGEGVEIAESEKEVPYNSDVIAPMSDEVPVPNFCFVQSDWSDDKGELLSLENIKEDTDFYATYNYVSNDLNLFTFNLNSNKQSYSVSAKDTNLSGKVALPETYNGKPVDTVAKRGFYRCNQITAIYIPSSYRTIKAEAFCEASDLTEIYIAEGLKTIEAFAFQSIGMVTMFELPASLNEIRQFGVEEIFDLNLLEFYDYASEDEKAIIEEFKFTTSEDGFYVWDEEQKVLYGDNGKKMVFVGFSVTELNVKESVEEIYHEAALHRPNLTEVNISGNVKEIGAGAFAHCPKLEAVNITGSVEKLCGYREVYVVFDGVEIHNAGVFFGTAIEYITFPAGLKNIGAGAFFRCDQLREVSIPNTLEYISEQAFENRNKNSLSKITMTGGINSKYYIDDNKAIIEKGTGIKKEDGTNGDTLLFYCGKAMTTEYQIPDGVTSLTPFSFCAAAKLNTLIIPEGVEEIPCSFAYSSISLTTVIIPASVKRITNTLPIYGGYFDHNIWGNVTWLGEVYRGAFAYCTNLMNVHFAENTCLEFISSYAFGNVGCSTFTVPASVTTIEPYAIYGEKLIAFDVQSENSSYCNDEEGVLHNEDMTTLIAYPAGKQNIEYILSNEVEFIGRAAFYSCINLRKVVMGETLKEIGPFAFDSCVSILFNEEIEELEINGLEEIVMNHDLQKIHDGAFRNCLALTKITFSGPSPELVSSLEDFDYSIDYTHRFFSYRNWDTYEFELFPNLRFEVPSQYILDYYEEWYNSRPYNVTGFNQDILPSITYTFDTKGGSIISPVVGVIATEPVPPSKANVYFHDWYLTDCDVEGKWDEAQKVVFPYLYRGEDNTTTLYARYEEMPLQNGQKDVWAYILTPGEYIRAELPSGIPVWFSYTPTVDCCADLSGFDMIPLWVYDCFDSLGVDMTKPDWFKYAVWLNNNRHYPLNAGVTYYFRFEQGSGTDYIAYVKLNLYDEEGEIMTLSSLHAILPSKFVF